MRCCSPILDEIHMDDEITYHCWCLTRRKINRIGLIQLELDNPAVEEVPVEQAGTWYDKQAAVAKSVMLDKNHDYGEAWRELSQESLADLILVKLLRIKQILHNDGKTLISEGIDANYIDIINYAVFALILVGEGRH